MRIVLVCNYEADLQQSMLRFGTLLQTEWHRRGVEVVTLAPTRGRLSRGMGHPRAGVGKWFGYFDKFVRFPRELRRRLGAIQRDGMATVVHVVDHSNAVYVPRNCERDLRWVVTCHDLLAVRGALGEETGCPASPLGRRLQRAIVAGLGRAAAVVCDSSSTREDLERLVPISHAQIRRVVLLGLNFPYRRLDRAVARARLSARGRVPWETPFLLHVGSNLARKNKMGVWRIFAQVAERWPGNLIFCGAPLPGDVRAAATAAGLSHRVFAVEGLDNDGLEAAYNLAHALLFPSICEGFGWPVIEAQACGCPVICSDRTSLPEIGGEGALVYGLADEAGMAESVLKLTNPEVRASVMALDAMNLERFGVQEMIERYGSIYAEALEAAPP